MNKKVLLVLHTPPPYGGGEIQALTLKNFFSGKENYLIYDYSRKSLTRYTQGIFGIKNLSFGVYWILKTAFLMVKHHPDKVYFTLPKGNYAFFRNAAIIAFAKLLHVRTLGELPGTSFHFLTNEHDLKYKLGLRYLMKVSEIRFLGDSIRQMHTKYGLHNGVVIDNGVYLPGNTFVQPDVFREKTLKLLYIGSIEFSKGIFNTIKAIGLCLESNIDVSYEIIGTWRFSQEQAEAEAYIKEHKLSEAITFHGQKLGQDKWDIFTQNAILVHPTFWDGVPLSILEAYGLGLCVISTYVGGIPDIMQNKTNGFLLEENTPENVFTAITTCYNDRESLLRISETNKKLFKQRFSLDIFLSNMQSWFEK